MEKFRIHVLQNKEIQISKTDWNGGDYYINEFYDIYLDGEHYNCAAFRCHFELEIEDILNAKQLFLKKTF